MGKVLEAFANGSLQAKRQYFERNSSYDKALLELCEREKRVMEVLGEENRKVLEQFISAQGRISDMEGTDNFQRGYQLGS